MTFFAFLVACSDGSTTSFKDGNTATIGEYQVKWAEMPAAIERPEVLTPMMFIFSETTPYRTPGVTQEDWLAEAARQNTSVQDLRDSMRGDVYKTRDGRLARCTIGAIKDGLCGRRTTLSLQQKQEMAKAALAAGSDCEWARFDPNLNMQLATMAGAEDYTLYAYAHCR